MSPNIVLILDIHKLKKFIILVQKLGVHHEKANTGKV